MMEFLRETKENQQKMDDREKQLQHQKSKMIIEKVSRYNKNAKQGVENEQMPEKDVDKIIEEVELELRQSIQKKLTDKIRSTYKEKKDTQRESVNLSISDITDEDKTGKFNEPFIMVEEIDEDEQEEEFSKNLTKYHNDSIKRAAFKTRYQKVKDKDKLTKILHNGTEIQKMILSNDEDMIEKAYVLLHDDMLRYRRGKFKKWICLSIGLVIACALALPTLEFAPMVFRAFYDN